MCGILLCSTGKDLSEFVCLNAKRGPDSSLSVKSKKFNIYSFVLHLRGNNTLQPIDTKEFIMAYNGEIYYYGTEQVLGNDTMYLSQLFTSCTTETDILSVLSKLRGEWALVIYFKALDKIYFSRDFLGRKSLLWHLPLQEPEHDHFAISSVTDSSPHWTEIPCTGIFSINLDDPTYTPILHSWEKIGSVNISVNLNFPLSLPPIQDDSNLPKDLTSYPVIEFHKVLDRSVQTRITSIPMQTPTRLGILFSGGIDCMVLAALCNEHLKEGEAIDLINVAFENPRVNKVKGNKKLESKLDKFEFIDTKHDKSITNDASKYETPDRLTGIKGVAELQRLYPTRKWNLVKVNVSFEEAMSMKSRIRMLMYPLTTVMDLSIAMAFWFASRGMGCMDEIGDDGIVITTPYHSKAKVLLSGLGADEQLGGYSRHRKSFERGSWEELVKEIKLDVERISTRNLGRDDRIISDHGKEVRFPFLDENVVEFLSSLEIQQKTDPRYIRAVGDKILLRLVAQTMGLQRASVEAKRAVQFGARTAKMEFSKEKGHQEL
jgi:asparagine synthetase B (glutamine-hydrolysing)